MLAFARRTAVLLASLAPLATAVGCGGEDPPPPPPTVLDVTVVDAATGSPVLTRSITVVAYDAVGALQAREIVQPGLDFGGSGQVAPGRYTLRVDAPGYAPQPEPFGPALVVSVPANVTTAVTVALEPVDGTAGDGTISGRVVGADGVGVAGVLVHAESTTSRTALTDVDGDYRIVGLLPNVYRVEALIVGQRAEARTNVSVTGSGVAAVDFALAPDTGATITATLGAGPATTSVAVALAATGEPIPGASVKVDFGTEATIAGVPPGRFTVVAALELDGRVVSPDILRRRMPPDVTVATDTMYRVSLPTVPAVDGVRVDTSTATGPEPEFAWSAYPGADFYVVEVRHLDGGLIWGGLDARGQPQFRVNAPNTSVRFGQLSQPLDGLVAGHAYRFRVFAGRDVPASGTFELIAGSEWAAGRFRR